MAEEMAGAKMAPQSIRSKILTPGETLILAIILTGILILARTLALEELEISDRTQL